MLIIWFCLKVRRRKEEFGAYQFEFFWSYVSISINVKFLECSLRSILPFLGVVLLQLMDVQRGRDKLGKIYEPVGVAINLLD